MPSGNIRSKHGKKEAEIFPLPFEYFLEDETYETVAAVVDNPFDGFLEF